MRSGPIIPEIEKKTVNRRSEALPLWESGGPAQVDLPWRDAAGLGVDDITSLLTGARTVALAVGSSPASRKLLDHVLGAVKAPTRLYLYGDRTLETDGALVCRLAGMADRVLARLGHRLPADWLVVDGGRTGRLLVGPDATERRWLIPMDGPLARSLFEAFRALFWFHSSREALPDGAGTVAFRPPLAAPCDDPGADLALPAGQLCVGPNPVDPVPDAEIRISPAPLDPGPARVIVSPPSGRSSNGGMGPPVSLDLPKLLAQRGHRVVWLDMGLPLTTVTHQRLVMHLVDAPISLRLEWPRAAAVDLFHRIDRAVQQPAWVFHPARRLGDVRGRVLLEGAKAAGDIQPSVPLDAGDVLAPLLDFDTASPARVPPIPPLALQATIQWRRVPKPLPQGARSPEFLRRWKALDEWAARQVEEARASLERLEGQEGLLSKLRRWLPSRDESVLERRRLRDEIDEIGESRPSLTPHEAKERMERLQQILSRLDVLNGVAHDQRQNAEDAQAEETQRSAWEQRVEEAETRLTEVRSKLAANEQANKQAQDELGAAQIALDQHVESLRSARSQALEGEYQRLEASLESARAEQKSLNDAHKGRPPKAERKAANKLVQQAEQAIARCKRERDGLASWAPPAAELGEWNTRIAEARRTLSELRAEANRLTAEASTHARIAGEDFVFKRPPRLQAPRRREIATHPPIPTEAPPELGDLYEHQGARFLAIRTWEQLRPAVPVASRLRAELVVAPPLT